MVLSIIIVNFKTPLLLLSCVNSILNTVPKELPFEIIVVDNNSNDDSEKIIKAKFQDIVWIQKKENDGFGRANNSGIKQAKGQYVLFLNSDVILLPGTVEKCLNEIQKNKAIGVLGCRLVNEDGSFQKSTYTGNGKCTDIIKNNLLLDYLFQLHARNRKIKAIMGSFMLIHLDVLEKVGLFDPDFFLYSEEIDLCRRIENNGYEIYFFPDAKAIHKHGGSSHDKDWMFKQISLSNALLQYKSNGLINYLLYHGLFCFNTITNFCAMWLLDKNYRHSYRLEQKHYFSNYFYYFSIPFLYSRTIGNGKRLLRRKLKN